MSALLEHVFGQVGTGALSVETAVELLREAYESQSEIEHAEPPAFAAEMTTVLIEREWQVEAARLPESASDIATTTYGERWVLLDGALSAAAAAGLPFAVEVLQPVDGAIDAKVMAHAAQLLGRVQSIFRSRPTKPVLLQVVLAADDSGSAGMLFALSALLKTAAIENPTFAGQVIEVPANTGATELIAIVQQDAAARELGDAEVRHAGAQRQVVDHKAVSVANGAAGQPWKDGGVYLITGGGGALGGLLAREICATSRGAAVICASRSASPVPTPAGIDARIEYRSLDVVDAQAVQDLVRTVLDTHGRLDGVIHCAGVTRDSFLLRKTADELAAVLAPKISGAVNLDLATADMDLDFFILFSSVAGVLGNTGQGDYAVANAFLDRFAEHRQSLHARGQRSGRTLSIAWPLWLEGGMRVDAEGTASMRSKGFRPLPTAAAMAALHRAYQSSCASVMVMFGEGAALQNWVAPDAPSMDGELLQRRTQQQLAQVFADVSGFALEKLHADEPFDRYGIDSLMITRLNQRLDQTFPGLSKTLFYEHPTLAELGNYLLTQHTDECRTWVAASAPARSHVTRVDVRPQARRREALAPPAAALQREPIAIIGISGRYPQARTLHEYWDNLQSGKDCISEIPPERWSLEDFYEPDRGQAVANGRSYCKWGGFLPGFAEFDPLFFQISPREARNLDPQERLFLQTCWALLEDAGYTRELIAARHGGRVGVFVGITKTGFELHGLGIRAAGGRAHPHTSFSSVANRVSYLFDLCGPSMPIDTMCSASLTAIHEACEHLLRGECEMAIAGGVNLYLHPSNYVHLSVMRMLSAAGRCKSFGKGGDGFVPGEGVGAVLLKPLSRALADGDQIRALIRASSINHGGKAQGYTVPSPRAQSELIQAALRAANIPARQVSYIEAHGTGTELGDPIEMAGLTQAFATQTAERQFCALGSVKSNIGHLEAAAGIAGLTKVVLQMQHRTLAPTLHAREPNPGIDFDSTPFFLQRELTPWSRPRLVVDGEERECPRVAGISAFGAGGSNAHVVVEEYIEPHSASVASSSAPRHPALIVVSAKNEERLHEQARQLVQAIERGELTAPDLHDIAHTLQVGREVMEQRLAFPTTSIEGMRRTLQSWIAGEAPAQCIHRNSPTRAAGADAQAAVERSIAEEDYDALLECWVAGAAVDWSRLHRGRVPRRISLPTYPFAPHRYWVDEHASSTTPRPRQATALHPLLQENTSDFTAQRFSSVLTGREIFLRDHVVGGSKVLPAVAYLEMAQAAIARSIGAASSRVLSLRDVVWLRPIVVTDRDVRVHIELQQDEAGTTHFQIYSGERELHSRGRASVEGANVEKTLDLAALKRGCSRSIEVARCYEGFATIGMEYGEAQRGLSSIRIGENHDGHYVLAQISLPPVAIGSASSYVLHPTVLDSATHACIVLSMAGTAAEAAIDHAPTVPFVVEQVDIVAPTPSNVFAYVRRRSQPGDTFDLDICDESGGLCVRLKGYANRRLADGAAPREARPEERQVPVSSAPAVLPDELRDTTGERLKNVFARTLKVAVDDIDARTAFDHYGINSMIALEVVSELEEMLGVALPKTLLFEYQSIEALSQHLIEGHAQALRKVLKLSESQQPLRVEAPPVEARPARVRRLRAVQEAPRQQAAQGLEIAIIGVAGRYPDARELATFWENLQAGKDSIGEIPAQRWDHSRYFDEHKGRLGKTYSKWGGFIDGVEEFDPLFFNISPREAHYMDPQERLFLQCVYETLEDAGYTRESLKDYCAGGLEGNVGVFVGVMYEEYQLHAAQAQALGESYGVGGNPAAIANRVSYTCNFHGPSMSVDTMCSSSLTSIHLACRSLASGECELAIAGGVNVSIHPNKYLVLAQENFASSTGRCEAFGAGGDGYVPGEGVGAVLLKPLARAIAEGDHIYAVIKATSLNHGGRMHGFTVPNPQAQAQVIASALQASGIDARTISYVEAHGTGTSLGDPIEIAGLSKAFAEHTSDKQYCAIGSAKSNIGHLESAAGIAGLTKVLLQMQHRTLVPSLHAQVLNPNIDFAQTPFVVQRSRAPWVRPVIGSREYPRIAGISSFGAGGTNAHLIVQEYETADEAFAPVPATPALIVLSAKNEAGLKERARQLLGALQGGRFAETSLRDIAYTLQVGREAMEHRLAFTAASLADLRQKLGSYVDGAPLQGSHRSEATRSKEMAVTFEGDDELHEAVRKWLQRGKYAKVLDLWVKGVGFDWTLLYAEESVRPRRVSLPTYAFAREKYWLEQPSATAPRSPGLHPLLHRNTSTLAEQRFSTALTGSEYFLRDHQINGEKILPGAAQLEMARAAAQHAVPDCGPLRLRNVTWIRPLVVPAPTTIHIALHPNDSGAIEYEIYSATGDDHDDSYSRGLIEIGESANSAERVDLQELRSRCTRTFEATRCYEVFAAMGLAYGPAHRGLQAVHVRRSDDQSYVLAEIALPASMGGTLQQYGLHPSLLDCALQATIGLGLAHEEALDGQRLRPRLPFALDSMHIHRDIPAQCWAYIRRSGDRSKSSDDPPLDIDIFDAQGLLCVRLLGVSSRELRESVAAPETLLLTPEWQTREPRSTAREQVTAEPIGERWVILDAIHAEGAPAIAANGAVAKVEIADRSDGVCSLARQVFERIRAILQAKLGRRALLQVVTHEPGEGAELDGALAGLLQTASLENPNLLTQLIQIDGPLPSTQLARRIEENALSVTDQHIRYVRDERQVAGWCAAVPDVGAATPWRDGGVYLITGGAGGLGMIFAREILASVEAPKLILAGRSAANLGELGSAGNVEHRRLDVTDEAAVAACIADILRDHGRLDGVIHAAGVIRDNFILKKTPAEFAAVIAPKTAGVVHLDRATAALPLDFFVMFSSTAGAFGNVGQADYAFANAFMDCYAQHRNELAARGLRHGRSLSIGWPLWADGGMRVDRSRVEQLRRLGVEELSVPAGLAAFYAAYPAKSAQVTVMHGDARKRRRARSPQREEAIEQPVVRSIEVGSGALADRTQQWLRQMIAKSLKVPVDVIEMDAAFDHYGINSMIAVEVTSRLEAMLGVVVPKTLLFEYQSIEALSQHLIEGHAPALRKVLKLSEPQQAVRTEAPAQVRPARMHRLRAVQETPRKQAAAGLEIAIIGVAGRYPQARELQTFWENLQAGKDSIGEIPPQRWDHSRYFDANKGRIGKTYSKWGGFIDGVEEFDPLFFNISPREAQYMDPQERLFLQCVYETLEDAGYTREGLEGNVGVFVGAMYEEYQLYAAQAQALGEPYGLWGTAGSIANRVSYCCNFHGPSMAVDTMCSSSLTSVHLACRSLASGECELAIAGGVNVTIHPNKYLVLAQGNFASSTGRCESFGAGGDGYVPGEGVGAVLLKPLARAIAEGDHIYAVIKATSLNHGGRTNGYTVPNPQAQAQLISGALTASGIDARTISYVEAHGTGTSLGDPIEITGLSKAFAEHTSDKQYCAIGSAKSNIGHLESAAGIVGLTKVLLQMQHRMLVPSLHAQVLNPNIDFTQTPFVVQRSLSPWLRPVIGSREYPRIAGISSFGAGGTNAHVIVQEYEAAPREALAPAVQKPALIVLSAKNETALKERARQLSSALGRCAEGSLRDIAYTLQVGREAMESRLAFTALSLAEVREKLESYLQNDERAIELYRGETRGERQGLSLLSADEDFRATVQSWLAKGKYGQVLAGWTRGMKVEWRSVYADEQLPRRVSLPAYPFAKERYWVDDRPTAASANMNPVDKPRGIALTALAGAAPPTDRVAPARALGGEVGSAVSFSAGDITSELTESLAAALSIPVADIDTTLSFVELGMDSVIGAQWSQAISRRFATRLALAKLYQYPNIPELAAYLASETRSVTCAT